MSQSMTVVLLVVLLLQCEAFTNISIAVNFYGEAQCPYCRRFVEMWHDEWQNEFIPYVSFQYVPWGNAYFATEQCGSGPYSSTERACWYDKCIASSSDNDNECFGGTTIYQHSEKEGMMDVYESCVIELFGPDEGWEFTYCAEVGMGAALLDDDTYSAYDVMAACVYDQKPILVQVIQHCYDTRAHEIEMHNARLTPSHPGVPYVQVDGIALNDPFNDLVQVICDKLGTVGEFPSICTTTTTTMTGARRPAGDGPFLRAASGRSE
jgi:hypothetical protein